MTKYFFIVLITAGGIPSSIYQLIGNEATANAQVVSIEIHSKYIGGNQHILAVELRNQSDREIELLSSNLPWGSNFSMALIVAGTDFPICALKPGPAPIADPGFAFTKIPAKKAVTGTIKLREKYPDIDRALSRSGVDVFLAYQIPAAEKISSNRTGAWVFIPKKK